MSSHAGPEPPLDKVVDHLADLTGLRDRDTLDVTLLAALRDLLRPLSCGVYRVVGDEPDTRWITRARLDGGDALPVADSHWAELGTLPPLAAHPERVECLHRQTTLVVPGPPVRAYFPLGTEIGTTGVLEVHTAHPLDEQALRVVDAILRIVRNFHGLLDVSERDSLTGLLNRKTFDGSLMRALGPPSDGAPVAGLVERRHAGTAAEPGGGWLGVVDIDHFKRINDGYGHLIGDEILLLMARVMRSCFRHHDRLYRFGGEEFVVLLRCAGEADALTAFDRLRTHVARYPFPQVGQVTVSVGVTGLRANDTPTSSFERADRAVYWVKQNGRNAVAHHADLVRRGLIVEADATRSDAELF